MNVSQKQQPKIETFSSYDVSKENYRMSLPNHLSTEAKSSPSLEIAFH